VRLFLKFPQNNFNWCATGPTWPLPHAWLSYLPCSWLSVGSLLIATVCVHQSHHFIKLSTIKPWHTLKRNGLDHFSCATKTRPHKNIWTIRCELETTSTASCLGSSKTLGKQSTCYGLCRCCMLLEEETSVHNWGVLLYTARQDDLHRPHNDMCTGTFVPPVATTIGWPLIRFTVPADSVKCYKVLDAQDGMLVATLVLYDVGSNPDAYWCVHIGWVKHSYEFI